MKKCMSIKCMKSINMSVENIYKSLRSDADFLINIKKNQNEYKLSQNRVFRHALYFLLINQLNN